jgi:hypothetical protein|tara:strand:+ start:440 stop:1192 length:753 start_codon:yes stop_codon:yes gene_type:complete
MAGNKGKTVAAKIKNEGGLLVEPLLTRPERVAIVALGRSCYDFIQEQISHATRRDTENPLFDEVWTLNRGFQGFPHDKLFVMDDLRWLEEHKDKKYAKWLKKHNRPIVTSTVYNDYPTAVEYPVHEVGEFIKDDIFAVNTVSYMVAYAMYTGVKHLSIYGADFFYPGGQTAEEGGQAVAYLLGISTGLQMMIHHIPHSSSLLYASKAQQGPGGQLARPLYGYHRKAEMEKAKGEDRARKAQQNASKKRNK